MKETITFHMYGDEKAALEAPCDGTFLQEILTAQPGARHCATLLGYFRACRLPKCRRAKCCLGRQSPERPPVEDDPLSWFPPCIDCHEKMRATHEESGREIERLRSMEAEAGDPDGG